MENGKKKSTFDLCSITKTFGSLIANDTVSLSFELGKIHAIVGENGAGKSTLMKIVNGLYEPDSGEIVLNGTTISITDPGEAARLGIGMVYQHFMLVPTLTVAENLILGNELHRYGLLNMKAARDKVKEVSERYGFNIHPDDTVGNLSVGKQQRIEIMKVLFRNSSVIVFDEPSAVLTPLEVKELYAIMRQLRSDGKTVIFITHKLQEVFDIAETVAVLRKGAVVGRFDVPDTTQSQIAGLMIGRDLKPHVNERFVVGETVCSVSELCVKNSNGTIAVDGLSFSVRAGEIFGIAGVDGNGQTELALAMTGLADHSGTVMINGTNIDQFTIAERKTLIAHIPENRHKHAAISGFTVAENAILGYQKSFSRKGILLNTAIADHTKHLIDDHNVQVSDPAMPFSQLSGGNQQKFVVARELTPDVPVILAVHPTRGVDIGAIEMIHALLKKKAAEGKAVILISAELSDITALSNRIAVMYKGRFNGIFNNTDINEAVLGMAMTGSVVCEQ